MLAALILIGFFAMVRVAIFGRKYFWLFAGTLTAAFIVPTVTREIRYLSV